jgi:hypothetical protein
MSGFIKADRICLVFDRVNPNELDRAVFKKIYVRDYSEGNEVFLLPTLNENGDTNKIPVGETWQSIISAAGKYFYFAPEITLTRDSIEKTPIFDEMDYKARGKYPEKTVLIRSEFRRAMEGFDPIKTAVKVVISAQTPASMSLENA